VQLQSALLTLFFLTMARTRYIAGITGLASCNDLLIIEHHICKVVLLQAKKVAAKLKKYDIKKVYISPFFRCAWKYTSMAEHV